MNIIYLRTSTEEQNPDNQKADCLSLGYENPEVFEEKQSAFKDKDRLIFESIKTKIQKGEVEHLICWDWDRLFRNRKRLKEFFEFCKMYKCAIHSFRQQFYEDLYKIPSPFNDIMQELTLNLMGWLAEDESKKKSDRVKIAFKNKKGDWGRPSLDLETNNLIVSLLKQNKPLREISKTIFYWDKSRNKKYVSVGHVHKIKQELNKENNRFMNVQEGVN